jgi:hypothetical protein
MPYKTYDQQRQYQAVWMWRRRMGWILENGPCVDCGSTQDLRVVYKDPAEKTVRVTSIWSLSEQKRTELLNKCVVLCRSCALAKRKDERQPDHGTEGRYEQGCRCQPCRAAHAVKMANWRASRRNGGSDLPSDSARDGTSDGTSDSSVELPSTAAPTVTTVTIAITISSENGASNGIQVLVPGVVPSGQPVSVTQLNGGHTGRGLSEERALGSDGAASVDAVGDPELPDLGVVDGTHVITP